MVFTHGEGIGVYLCGSDSKVHSIINSTNYDIISCYLVFGVIIYTIIHVYEIP